MLRQAVAKDPANPTLYSKSRRSLRAGDATAKRWSSTRTRSTKGSRAHGCIPGLASYTCGRGRRRGDRVLRGRRANESLGSREPPEPGGGVPGNGQDRRGREGAANDTGKSGEEYAPAYNELGMAGSKGATRAAARGYFEKAAQLDPKYQLNLARLYKMAGDTALARAAFEAFLAAKGDSPEYRQIIAPGEAANWRRCNKRSLPGQAGRKPAWCAHPRSGWSSSRSVRPSRPKGVAGHVEHVEEVELHPQLGPFLDGEALEQRRVAVPHVGAEDRLVDPGVQRAARAVGGAGSGGRRRLVGHRAAGKIVIVAVVAVVRDRWPRCG